MKIIYPADAELEKGTKNLLRALTSNTEFIQHIIQARLEIGIPRESFKEDLKSASEFLRENKKKLQVITSKIIDKFRFPTNWNEEIQLLILLNFTLIYKNEISLSYSEHPIKRVSIDIYGRVTPTKLRKWIESHTGQINQCFDTLGLKKTARVNRKNVELFAESMKQHDVGRSLKQIIEYFSEEYKEDQKAYDSIPDEGALGTGIRRIKSDIEG
ncbi:MAG: hypothetical protein AAB656_04700 [Patescibacteria group bacterium]